MMHHVVKGDGELGFAQQVVSGGREGHQLHEDGVKAATSVRHLEGCRSGISGGRGGTWLEEE